MAPYITVEGERTLREELEQLWRVERPLVTQSVSDAAAQGDRSENAEYIYGKKRLREIDSRVRFLRKRLDVLKVVREPPTDCNKVYFGAWVDLEDENGNPVRYRLVGPDELNPSLGYISIDSVLARALLGKPRHTYVLIETPAGRREYHVLNIHYGPSEPP